MAAYKSSVAKTCHLQWFQREKYNFVEAGLVKQLELSVQEGNVYTALKLDTKRHEVDVFFTPAAATLPTVVIQSCWEPDYQQALPETAHYLREGKGAIQKVFLLIWREEGGQTVACRLEVYKYNHLYNYKSAPLNRDHEYAVLSPIEPSGQGNVLVPLSAYELRGNRANTDEHAADLSLAVLRSLIYSTIQLDVAACGPASSLPDYLSTASTRDISEWVDIESAGSTMSKLLSTGPLVFSAQGSKSEKGLTCSICESRTCCSIQEHAHASQSDWRRVGTLGPYPWMHFAAYTTLYMPIVGEITSQERQNVYIEETCRPKTPVKQPLVVTPPESPQEQKRELLQALEEDIDGADEEIGDTIINANLDSGPAKTPVGLVRQIQSLLLMLQQYAVPNSDEPNTIEDVGLGMKCTQVEDRVRIDINCSMLVLEEVHKVNCPQTRKVFHQGPCPLN